MKKKIVRLLSLLFTLSLLMTCTLIFQLPAQRVEAAQSTNITAPPDWLAVPGADLSVGTFVAAYNAADHGIRTTAQNASFDNTSILQNLINRIYNLGGGALYIPKGQYRVNGTLTLRKGVTIRGDWKEPVKGEPVDPAQNTVLLAYRGRNAAAVYQNPPAAANLPFIEMEPESCVANVTIYYPEQTPDNIVSYSPAITMGLVSGGYFGNEYCNVRDVTLVNPYIGIQYNYYKGGASPTVNGVYGSPLKLGVEVDNIADIGRIEGLHFSPDYWIGSGLTAFTDATRQTLREYVYQNGIGVSMRRNDWSFACYLDIDGYSIGFNALASHPAIGTSTPNGHHYAFNLTGCKTGIRVDDSANVGIMFTDITITDCEEGFVIPQGNSSPVQLLGADIRATRSAIRVDAGMLMLSGSVIREGIISVGGGTLNALGNRIETAAPQIAYGPMARGILTDNAFAQPYAPDDRSLYLHDVIDTPDGAYMYDKVKVPAFPAEVAAPLPKAPAAGTGVYVVDTANAVKFPGRDNDLTYTTTANTPDSTQRIQEKLDLAYTEGGGVVFLPPGKYRVAGTLHIPGGVELRGAGGEIASVPHGVGSVLELYAGRGNPGSAPAITMDGGSGIRGVVINYPEQVIWDAADGKLTPKEYPYAVQGRGDNIYLINVGLRAVWNGLDFDTYRCDNLYIDFVTGHVFRNALKYGNNAEGGVIKNVMANVIVYGCGDESKFGAWANSYRNHASMPADLKGANGHTYTFSYENLDFMEIGDCKNTYMYNNFHYGSEIGIHFMNQGNGGAQNTTNLGLGIDGSRQSVIFDTGLTGTFNFINSQTVSINGSKYADATYMIGKAASGFTANFYGSDYWGQPRYAFVTEANSGTFNLFAANVAETGQGFLNLSGGEVHFIASRMRGNTGTAAGSQSYIRQTVSLLPYTGTPAHRKTGPGGFDAAENTGVNPNPILSRTGWQVKASHTLGGSPATYAINGNTNQEWKLGWQQNANNALPHWFMVDLGAARSFNTLLLEHGGGGNDWPSGAQVYVSNTNHFTNPDPKGAGWTLAAESFGSANAIELGEQTARYVMIIRPEGTPDRGAYWAIKDLRLAGFQSLTPPAAYTVRQSSFLGYTLVPETGFGKTVLAGGTAKFRLELDPDFLDSGYSVSVNGSALSAAGGVYTVSGVTADQVVTVSGLVKKQKQTLAFPYNNRALNLVKGTSATHALSVTGGGSGGVIYRSANPAVATVDAATGRVTGVNIGTTLIIAEKAADAQYAGAQAQIILNVTFNELEIPTVPPAILGDTAMRLAEGYAAVSTGAYLLIGTEPVTVTKTAGPGEITWNDAEKRLDIAAGLPGGVYAVTLTAGNGIAPDAVLTFTLTVTASPAITGDTAMTLTEGYAAASTGAYTLTGTPTPTVTAWGTCDEITWNDAEKRLEIAPGLPEGTYTVELAADNEVTPEATLTFVLTVKARGAARRWGDVSGDDKVDSTDARMILQYEVSLVAFADEQEAVADVSGDDKIDSTDARMILQYEVELIGEFPAEKA